MKALLAVSAVFDHTLSLFGKVGAWAGILLIFVVCIDVVTRYLGAPKPFGWNSTQLQEAEYWLHTLLFALMIGWAYTRQAHVRIDLVRDLMPVKIKLVVEAIGASLFLFTYAALGTWYTSQYAYTSFLDDERSRSAVGLGNIWILKFSLVVMFALMAIAAISQFIKALAGLMGKLPDEKLSETLGGNL